MTCYGHLELHKRLISTLKELKKASASKVSDTALLEESMDESLKIRIANMVGRNPSPEALVKAYGLLLNSIQILKEMSQEPTRLDFY